MRHKLRAFVALAVLAGIVAAIGAPTASATTPLSASKTATGHWARSFGWTIDKSVTPDSWALTTGQSGTSTYTIVVTKGPASDSVWVDGEVCVTNNGEWRPRTSSSRIASSRSFPPARRSSSVDPLDVSSIPFSIRASPTATRTRSRSLRSPEPPGTRTVPEPRSRTIRETRAPRSGRSVTALFNIPSSPTPINDRSTSTTRTAGRGRSRRPAR